MGNHPMSTPYDDVYKTLLNDCTSLIIPVVNEMFGEHYTGNETIEFLPNEHFINLQDNNTKEKNHGFLFSDMWTGEEKISYRMSEYCRQQYVYPDVRI
jgi:hypothetical protein